MDESAERAEFEAFAEQWIGRSMEQLKAGGVWGLGLDSFSWACWQTGRSEQRARIAEMCLNMAAVSWDEWGRKNDPATRGSARALEHVAALLDAGVTHG